MECRFLNSVDEICSEMENLLRDEVKVDHLKQSKELAGLFFRDTETIHKLFKYVTPLWSEYSYILREEGCDEESTFYISKVASELVREFPDTQKELIVNDKSLMRRTHSLIDEVHFSPQ